MRQPVYAENEPSGPSDRSSTTLDLTSISADGANLQLVATGPVDELLRWAQAAFLSAFATAPPEARARVAAELQGLATSSGDDTDAIIAATMALDLAADEATAQPTEPTLVRTGESSWSLPGGAPAQAGATSQPTTPGPVPASAVVAPLPALGPDNAAGPPAEEQTLPDPPVPAEFELDSLPASQGGFDQLPPDDEQLPLPPIPRDFELGRPSARRLARRPGPAAQGTPAASGGSPASSAPAAQVPPITEPPTSATGALRSMHQVMLKLRSRLLSAGPADLERRRAEFDASLQVYEDYRRREADGDWLNATIDDVGAFAEARHEDIQWTRDQASAWVQEKSFAAGGAVQDLVGGGAAGVWAGTLTAELLSKVGGGALGTLLLGPNLLLTPSDVAAIDDEVADAVAEIERGQAEGDEDAVLRGQARLVVAFAPVFGPAAGVIAAGAILASLRRSSKTRQGLVRTNPADWRHLRDVWDGVGFGDVLSDDNRRLIARGRTPVVDESRVRHFPGDAGLMGEQLRMHHLGGGPIAVPLPESRHLDAHMPGGFRNNPGGPGTSG